MHRILIAAADRSRWSAFARRLADHPDLQIAWASDGRQALADAEGRPPTAVVIDGELPDMTAFELARRLIAVSAQIYTAVASGLSPEAFHETGEGLGILMQLPPQAGAAEAELFLSRLRRVAAIPAPVRPPR